MISAKAKWCSLPRYGIITLTFIFLVTSFTALAQTVKQVKGVISEESGRGPLPGARISVRGTSNATSTNANGEFTIRAKSTDVLEVFYIGYETAFVTVGSRTDISVALKPTASALDEVVVVGYGQVRKADLTGSVATVNMEDLVKAPVGSFAEALAGRVPGVQVSSSDGQPGDAPNIVIRGAGSLTQSSAPLYVVDGFPMEDFEVGSVSQSDIESINILKDASATAIYGARAANGVVLIETKKGQVGRAVVSFDNSLGFQRIGNKLEVMSPYEFVKYHNELKPTVTETRYFQDGKTLESYRNITGIDWQEELFQQRPTQINNLAIRGGSPKTRYSISGNIFKQDGIVINTGSKRYQGRVAVDQEINSKLKVGINANRSYTEAFGVQASVGASSNSTNYLFYNGWGYRPVVGNEQFDLLNEDVDEENINTFEIRVNPVRTAKNTYRRYTTKGLTTVAYADYAINKNFKLKVTGNLSNRDQQNDAFYNSLTPQGSPRNPTNTRGVNGSTSFSTIDTWSNENLLTYSPSFSKIHKINAIGGFSAQGSKRSLQGVAVQQIPNEELGLSGFDEGTPYSSVASSSKQSLVSFFGRVRYNYRSKYSLEGTFRGDGSSKFSKGNRWAYFPSGSFAWNMTSEPFMKSLPGVSNSKLRFSYGLTGNNRVGEFDYLPGLSFPLINSYSFNNGTPTKAVIPDNLGNSDLKWETTEQMDIGYDLGFFKEKIQFTVDLYRKTTRDLLLDADLPLTTGYTSAYMNVGKLRNEGLELSLNTLNINKKNFTWETNFNISFNRNKVLKLVEGQTRLFSFVSFETQYNNTPLYIAQVDKPAAMFYGYIFDGVYQFEDFNTSSSGSYQLKPAITANGNARETIQPGDIKYKDLNGDGTVDSYDQTVIGRGLPIHTGGLSNNFRYKNLSLNVFFQWSHGNDIFNANRMVLEGNGLIRTDLNQFASYADRWTPENPSNKNYRANGQGPLGRYSTRTLEDGSYLRLKTVSLGYDIPKSITKSYFSKLKLIMSAQNLVTWTKYAGMDPEVSVRNSILTPGFDYSAYPQSQTLVFGLNATF